LTGYSRRAITRIIKQEQANNPFPEFNENLAKETMEKLEVFDHQNKERDLMKKEALNEIGSEPFLVRHAGLTITERANIAKKEVKHG
jgi:hypothetical protein